MGSGGRSRERRVEMNQVGPGRNERAEIEAPRAHCTRIKRDEPCVLGVEPPQRQQRHGATQLGQEHTRTRTKRRQ